MKNYNEKSNAIITSEYQSKKDGLTDGKLSECKEVVTDITFLIQVYSNDGYNTGHLRQVSLSKEALKNVLEQIELIEQNTKMVELNDLPF